MPNIMLQHEAVVQPGTILPSERHIFPGTTPHPHHTHRRSYLLPKPIRNDVGKDLFMLFVIYVGHNSYGRTMGPCSSHGCSDGASGSWGSAINGQSLVVRGRTGVSSGSLAR